MDSESLKKERPGGVGDVTYHLLEVRKAEDRVVDFGRFAWGCYVGHGSGQKCRYRRERRTRRRRRGHRTVGLLGIVPGARTRTENDNDVFVFESGD